MSKLPQILVWVTAVTIGFGVGRWSAPSSPSASLAVPPLDGGPLAAGGEQPATGRLAPTAVAVPVSASPPPRQTISRRSYAADHQQLQALLALATSRPQAAMESAQGFRGAIKAKAEVEILDMWAAQDPNAAWNWVARFAPDNNAYYIRLLEVIGRNEPRTAIQFAERLVGDHRELRKDIYQSLLAGIAQAGAYDQATQILASAALESPVKAELTGALLADWATYEPQAAMQWLTSQPGEPDESALVRLGQSWAVADPQGATQYLATLKGQVRDDLLLPSFNRWLAADPATAASWLAASPRDASYDPLINELVSSPGFASQVKTALDWTERMQDPQQRLSTLTGILSATRQRDASAALAYLRDIRYLNDAERQQLASDLALIE